MTGLFAKRCVCDGAQGSPRYSVGGSIVVTLSFLTVVNAMSSENLLPTYQSINTALAQQKVALTAAEMHGLLSGLLCGGCSDGSWSVLVHDLTNDGQAFGYPLGDLVKGLYEETKEELEEDGFSFEMLIPAMMIRLSTSELMR
ncbi:Uncharacterized protein conserved in bacteria [Leminorella richardii]|uniref:Uncharacterized protein conserved in bacteria n=1 Tax=Leminorella richardii TaxID=158841 RepID=A0A2X4U9S9_9GAMM|nr:Uncharacterized protein conserved in bacteria [Leminorella richardii]